MLYAWLCWAQLAFAGGVGLADLPPAEASATHIAPKSSRVDIPVAGEFRLVGVENGVRSYEVALPVRPRVMFLSSMPPGMDVRREGQKLTFATQGSVPNTWAFSAKGLTVRVAANAPRPVAGQYLVRWPEAQARQVELDSGGAGRTDATQSVRRSVQVGGTTRSGILLAAPAQIAWQVDVPVGGVLRFSAAVIPPEVALSAVSDGVDVVVRVGGVERGRFRAQRQQFKPFEVDLSSEGGTTARLEFQIEDADTTDDYAFIAEPRVVVPSPKPQRVVLAFIDTLRRDHLGTYGYARAPSPYIDALGKEGVVFEDARTVAPWTLPSTRSVLTGMQPERWGSSARLPEMLAARGWATGAFVGNIYLTGNFEMAVGWGEHSAINLPYGDYEVERGIEFLDRHADEDALVMVHFMDLHLPYKEIWPWRSRYVTTEPPGLGAVFNRGELMQYADSKAKKASIKSYLEDRYDQNLAAVDSALQRLFDAAGSDAVVVIFSDHGEEFFDHGDLEHGHSLHDELLRVPLILRAPGLAPRRVAAPVSLLDITPTVLDLIGASGAAPGPFDGMSLAAIARGEADDRFTGRALAFGRLLYGPNAWGSLLGTQKWLSQGGHEQVYDLATDPTEQTPAGTPDRLAGRRALGAALNVRAEVVLRVMPMSVRGTGSVSLSVPGGVAGVWVGDEPTQHATVETRVHRGVEVDGLRTDVVEMDFSSTGAPQREVYVLPERAPELAVQGAALFLERGPSQELLRRGPDVGSGPLARVSKGSRIYEVSWAVVPQPFGEEIDGFDPESAAALKAIGYLDDNRGGNPSSGSLGAVPGSSGAVP